MTDKRFKAVHDTLHEFAKVLREWADKFDKRAEELHTYNGNQTRIDDHVG
ncbi:MAG: hypothetical protein ACYTFW_14775 [Planctomycetota bacterium]|jgi:GrpB-like predicted nucleotidyltransferase (UPF0157 family)